MNTNTSTNINTFGRMTILGIAGVLMALAAVFGTSAPAGAALAPPAGTYSGNECSNANWQRGLAGGVGCIFYNGGSLPAGVFSISAGAFDARDDGLRIRTDLLVEQRVNGRWQVTNTMRATVSRGQGFSQVGNDVVVWRVLGRSSATHVRVRLQVCTNDAHRNTNVDCTAGRPINWSWTS